MMRELRLALMTLFISWAFKMCPKDSIKTLLWFGDTPFDLNKKEK